MHSLCTLAMVGADSIGKLDPFIVAHRRVPKGGQLFRTGSPFRNIFSVRSGSFKTSVVTGDGREQIVGFYLVGELLGLDGIEGLQRTTATALENSEVCVFPYDKVARAAAEVDEFGSGLIRLMSRAIVKEQRVLLMLGTMHSEERVASFLLDLVDRQSERTGAQVSKTHLSMSRSEIGSFLGLTQETVSRAMAQLSNAGLIRVRAKTVEILDFEKLRKCSLG
jgi:CRP/FNR family transcriptional regulator